MDKIYFDNSATTPLTPEAREKMLEAMDVSGNPSSLHTMGVEAGETGQRGEAKHTHSSRYKIPDDARAAASSSSRRAAPRRTDRALLGTTGAKNYTSQKNIIISDSEHPAIMETAKELERRGFIVHKIPTADGIPDYEMIEQVADSDTILVSFMLVNNETGAIYDVRRISDIVKKANPAAIVHTDCTQAFLKIRFTAKSLGADMITISGHQDRRSEGRRSPLGLAGDS